MSSPDPDQPIDSASGEPDAEGSRAVDDAAEEASAGSGEGRRRRRNRRRGRRGADRVAGAEPAGSASEGEGADAGRGAAPVEVVREVAVLPADATEVFAHVLSGHYDHEEPAPTEGEITALGGEGSLPAEAAPASDVGLSSTGNQGVATEGSHEAADDEAVVEGQRLEQADARSRRREPARRVLAPDPDAPKLQKVLAQSGVGSRRDLEQMIVEGRICVNGQPAHVGQRVSFGDRITLDGKPVRVRITPPLPRVLAYHKPVGEVVTHDDPQQRPTVFRRLPRLQHGKWQSVGRLDINTEGLLLFTNSGDLANRLMHPRFGVEREYAVRVLGQLDDEAKDRLLQGVEIDGQPAAFQRIEDGGGDGANRWYRVVINEGRHREVRRLFEAVGLVVSRLIRIRYGSVVLPRGLRRGDWVDLASQDVRALRQTTGMPHSGAASAQDGPEKGRRGGRRGGRGRRGEGPRDMPRDGYAAPASLAGDWDGDAEPIGPIPNPLQQTYDKRALQQDQRRRREPSEDGPIPNPLQQTYDRRAVQGEKRRSRELDEDGPIPNPLQQTFDRRFVQGPGRQGTGPSGPGRTRRKPAQGKPGAVGGQPDPMRTSVGYIGADAFLKKGRKSGRGGRGGGR